MGKVIRMLCPHCRVSFHDDETTFSLVRKNRAYPDGPWNVAHQMCPNCSKLVLHLVKPASHLLSPQYRHLVWPKASSRAPCAPEVPKDVAEDYTEACLVLDDSPKAAAALGRRCLQYVLREAAKVKHQDLSKEIQEVLDRGQLPTHIAGAIDSVRNIGNLAAHPMKMQHTGEILPVEPGEAEWTLDTVEALFDYYYVQPALLKAKKDALDKKLASAGKPKAK